MTKKGWKKLILRCFHNNKQLELLSDLLEQNDVAKQLLIDKGYRCTGMSLLETVKNLPGEIMKKSYKDLGLINSKFLINKDLGLIRSKKRK